MRVVVTGATGNVGTSVVRALAAEPAVRSIIGLARRVPPISLPKVEWRACDVATGDLEVQFHDADAVIHLAWQIQPSHDPEAMRRTNVEGSRRVFEAAARRHVPALVHASSVGAYSPGPKDRRVDEDWPTGGIATSLYSQQKAEVERILDRFEGDLRIVRLRKALVFQASAASEIRRLFLGPLFPSVLLSPGLARIVPDIEGLVFQAVHADDAGQAYRLALLTKEARGAFNIAADPVLSVQELCAMFDAWSIPVPRFLARAFVSLAWRLHLQPSDVGWLDLALECPVMNTVHAQTALGWKPEKTSRFALLELLEAMREGASYATPPLASPASEARTEVTHERGARA